jgi:2-C-methyl-D-erythritol 4-phosphate cytidylyltransferase
MNAAVIIAGGTGSRMHMDIPKQFINIYDKPVIIYTLEGFQRHPEIDMIGVVCLDGWQDTLKRYAKQYGITKLKWIISGGRTGQESIRNGVYRLEGELSEDDNVVIHDGIRPMVDSSVLSDVLRVCSVYGNAVTATPFTEQIFLADEGGETTSKFIPRDSVRKVATPQAYRFGELISAYRRAFAEEKGIYGSSYTNTMMVELGYTLHFAAGSDKNIKLTTKDDLEMFKAYLRMEADI